MILKIDRTINRTRIFLFNKRILSWKNRYYLIVIRKIIQKHKEFFLVGKYIVLFDCLYDKYAEAIDAFTLFKYLQKQGIRSKYFLLKGNRLEKRFEVEAYENDIIIIDKQEDLFLKHEDIIAQAYHVITSFGLDSEYNKILKKLPFLDYVFINHGIDFFKAWYGNLYNSGKFDKVLVQMRYTEDLYVEKDIWPKESMIYSGLPRWDNLVKREHKDKSILIFFTWRKSFEKTGTGIKEYINCLKAFIGNEKLQYMLKKHSVNLKLAVHHALYYNKLFIPDIEGVKLVNTNDISKEILKSDLLITDYSSVCFDFMYLDIPVIFYRFDSDVIYKNILDQQSLELCKEKDKYLYNYFYQNDVNAAINKIGYYIENDFKLEEENKEKNKAFFWSRDNNNCARLWKYINSQNDDLKISIIVPVYNTEKYLKKCLDSLSEQTYKDIEVLCIDDGSQDNSLKMLKEYEKEDQRIKVFSQENLGPAAARNIGLENITGKYIMFCDSDDWYEPNMCETMMYTIIAEEVDVVCCTAQLHYEIKRQKIRERYYENRNFTGKKTLNTYYITKTNVLLWNKIFKFEIIKKYNIRFPVNHMHEDDAFWYMYSLCSGSIFYLQKKMYNYGVRHNSIMARETQSSDKHRMDRLSICIYVYEFLQKNKLLKEKTSEAVDIFKHQLSIWTKNQDRSH